MLASGSQDETIKIWDVLTGDRIKKIIISISMPVLPCHANFAIPRAISFLLVYKLLKNCTQIVSISAEIEQVDPLVICFINLQSYN